MSSTATGRAPFSTSTGTGAITASTTMSGPRGPTRPPPSATRRRWQAPGQQHVFYRDGQGAIQHIYWNGSDNSFHHDVWTAGANAPTAVGDPAALAGPRPAACLLPRRAGRHSAHLLERER